MDRYKGQFKKAVHVPSPCILLVNMGGPPRHLPPFTAGLSFMH